MFHLFGNCIFSVYVIWCCFNGGVVVETLDQLKEIVKNAPFENVGEEIFINTHGNYILFYEDDFYTRDNGKWVKCCGFLPCYGLRSLSDIKRIIELMEGQKKAYQAHVALEEIKQKYNGENKIAKELLKLAYECDEFALSGDLRKDIKEFLGGL